MSSKRLFLQAVHASNFSLPCLVPGCEHISRGSNAVVDRAVQLDAVHGLRSSIMP